GRKCKGPEPYSGPLGWRNAGVRSVSPLQAQAHPAGDHFVRGAHGKDCRAAKDAVLDGCRVAVAQVVIEDLAPDRQILGEQMLGADAGHPADLGLTVLDVAANTVRQSVVTVAPTVVHAGQRHAAGQVEQRVVKRDTLAGATGGDPGNAGLCCGTGDEADTSRGESAAEAGPHRVRFDAEQPILRLPVVADVPAADKTVGAVAYAAAFVVLG